MLSTALIERKKDVPRYELGCSESENLNSSHLITLRFLLAPQFANKGSNSALTELIEVVP